MSPKTGRPKSEHAKTKLLQVRMDEVSMAKLDECAKAKETTRANIVREGIELVSVSLKEQKK